MNGGGKERLRDPIRLLRDRSIQDLGEGCDLHRASAGTPHMYTAFPFSQTDGLDRPCNLFCKLAWVPLQIVRNEFANSVSVH